MRRRALALALLLLPSCGGSPKRDEPQTSPVVVEGVQFDGTGDTYGRECFGRIKNTSSGKVTVECRIRFRTDNGKELVGPPEQWTRVELGANESRAIKSVCPFSTAAKAEVLVRAR